MDSDRTQATLQTDVKDSAMVADVVETEVVGTVDQIAPVKFWTVGTLKYTLGQLAVLFGWLLLGDFALYLRERSIGPIGQLYLKGHGASDTVIGSLFTSVPLFVTILVGPIVSYRSDRLRSRWGRRIPFLLLTTPISVIGIVGMAFSSRMGSGLVQLGWMSASSATIAIFGFFWVIFSVAGIVSLSVFSGLINDVVPGAVMGRFYGLFRTVSLIDAVIFNWFLLPHGEQHYFVIFLSLAVVFGLGFLLMTLNVKEGQPPPIVGLTKREGLAHAVRTYFRDCYSKPYYLLCFCSTAAALTAFSAITTFQMAYARHMGVDMTFFGRIMSACAICSLCITFPLGILVDMFHPLRMVAVTMLMNILVTGLGAWFISGTNSFTAIVAIQTILMSCYYTSAASLTLRLYPRAKYAQFQSANDLMTSLLGAGIGPVLGMILDYTDHLYRITYGVSCGFSVVSAICFILVYRRFLQLGGPANYVPPTAGVVEGVDVAQAAANA